MGKVSYAMEAVRINKYLSSSGFCSRRAADRYVEEGRVTIDGITALTGAKVLDGQTVCVDGQAVFMNQPGKVFILNKPAGYISSLSDGQGKGIRCFIPEGLRLFPVGRLDKDSEGLMLLTNDGELMNNVLNASNGHEKEYIVTTDRKITNDFIRGMEKGVPITNGATGKKIITAPCKITKIDEHSFKIIIIQGLNRQIRRMCGHFGFKVLTLKRIRIMNVSLGELKTGEIKELESDVLKELYRQLG